MCNLTLVTKGQERLFFNVLGLYSFKYKNYYIDNQINTKQYSKVNSILNFSIFISKVAKNNN